MEFRLLAILIILLAGILPLSSIVTVSGEFNLPRIISVNCETLDNITYLNIIMEFPTPGYNISYNYTYTNNKTLTISIHAEKPTNPVAQVITKKGITLNLTTKPEQIIIYINSELKGTYICENKTQEPGSTTSSTSQSTQYDTNSTSSSINTEDKNNLLMSSGLIGAIAVIIAVILSRKS